MIIHQSKLFTFPLGILFFTLCIPVLLYGFDSNSNQFLGIVTILFFLIFGFYCFVLPFVYRVVANEKGLIVKYDKRFMFWVQAESVVNIPWSGIKRIEWWGGDIYPTGGYHFICALPYKKELRLALNLVFCNRKKAMKIILPNVNKNKIAKEILEQFGYN